jgi:hypothetical protein
MKPLAFSIAIGPWSQRIGSLCSDADGFAILYYQRDAQAIAIANLTENREKITSDPRSNQATRGVPGDPGDEAGLRWGLAWIVER